MSGICFKITLWVENWNEWGNRWRNGDEELKTVKAEWHRGFIILFSLLFYVFENKKLAKTTKKPYSTPVLLASFLCSPFLAELLERTLYVPRFYFLILHSLFNPLHVGLIPTSPLKVLLSRVPLTCILPYTVVVNGGYFFFLMLLDFRQHLMS